MAIYQGYEIDHLNEQQEPQSEILPAPQARDQMLMALLKEQLKQGAQATKYQQTQGEQAIRYLDSLAQDRIKQDLNYNNGFESYVRANTQREFVDFVRYKERAKEEQAIRTLESKGVIKVNWDGYYGREPDTSQDDAKAMRIGIGICIGLFIAFLIF